MKKMMLAFMLIISIFSFCGCSSKENENVIRIHIRANSNSEEDQSIKLEVRDNIITYITPILANCNNSSEVKNVLQENLSSIKNISDGVLESNGFDYVSTPKMTNEYFPSRVYDGIVFGEGYYDALIINLGSGSGNNWWCVAYPPLCFVGENIDSGSIQYKSKLVEIINKFFGK